MNHRKKGGSEGVSPNLLQAVLNKVLETLEEIKKKHTIAPTTPIVYDAPRLPINHTDEPKQYQERVILRSAEQWHELKRDCASREEWEQIKEQINSASNLSSKQKQFIISTP